MQKSTCWVAIAATLSAVSIAHAHGPGIDYVGGQVVVESEDPQPYPFFVYIDEFAFNFKNLGWQSVDGGGNLVVGDLMGLEFLDGAPLFGLGTSQFLFFHNGTSFADPGDAALQGLGTLTVISKSSLVSPTVSLDTVILESGLPHFHAHLGVFLDGNATGAYATWLRSTTNHSGVGPSDPYLLILNNGLSPAAFQKAIGDFVEMAAIPEASSLLLTGAAAVGMGWLATRRRKSKP